MNERPSCMIIGAGGGIGSALARILAQSGVALTLCGRNIEGLGPLAAELDAVAVTIDARDGNEMISAVKSHIERFGRIDGMVNCAGSILIKPAHLTSDREFDETLATNLTTAFNTVRAAVRPMMAQKSGSIVLVSSAVAERGLINHEAIAAAKGGVAALARSAAATYASRNVRVNCVAPGLVDTPLTARIRSNEASLEQSIAMHALGRLGQPEDVAAAIAWLLDDSRSGWVTGQVIGIDGGLGSLMPRR